MSAEYQDTIDTSHIQLVVPLEHVMRLKPFVSKDECRFYLQGVRFENGREGTLLVATDGHRLGAFNSTEAICQKPGIVRLPARMPRADKEKKMWLVVGKFAGTDLALIVGMRGKHDAQLVAENATLRNALVIYADALIEAEFPDWRKVIPKEVGPASAGFNSAYLGDFAAAIGAKKGAPIMLYGTDRHAPHIVTVGNEGNFIGVQMPMRTDPVSSLPTWLDAPKPAKRKKAA